jgi:hypothetical protein
VSGQVEGDGGVPHGELLVRFAEAAIVGSDDEIRQAREDVATAIGEDALVDAAAVVAIFCCNVRVADASGVPLDAPTAEVRERIGQQVGIARYSEAEVP